MGAAQGQGKILHLKAQVALDENGDLIGKNDMRKQVQKVFENIQKVLHHVGGEMKDIFSISHYVTNMDAFAKVGDLRKAFFQEPYPISTTIEVRRLFHPDWLVEVSAIAEIPEERFLSPD